MFAMAPAPAPSAAEPAPHIPAAVSRLLPPDDPWRAAIHNEVHARPPDQIAVPAHVFCVAVLNAGVSREDEWRQLRTLPGAADLPLAALQGNFLRLNLPHAVLKWERHNEFTRYSVLQALPAGTVLESARPDVPALAQAAGLPPGWLATLPGRTVAAMDLCLLHAALDDANELEALRPRIQQWFGADVALVGSRVGRGHSLVMTPLVLQPDGFERLLLLTTPATRPSRAGRTAQRLLDLECYRLMALRGLPVAKVLGPQLAQAERDLGQITGLLDGKAATDAELLDRLIALAATVERLTAEHGYRFSATQAYDALVRERISELREVPVPSVQTLGEFMQRRLSPAIATVNASARRLSALSDRVARTSDLLRTRVGIATEAQNQQLLEKLTRGQELQLRLQSTVEGLSIAAISYYVVSLLLYGIKAAKAAGLPVNAEIATGALIPLVLWTVWRTIRRIHERLHADAEPH